MMSDEADVMKSIILEADVSMVSVLMRLRREERHICVVRGSDSVARQRNIRGWLVARLRPRLEKRLKRRLR